MKTDFVIKLMIVLTMSVLFSNKLFSQFNKHLPLEYDSIQERVANNEIYRRCFYKNNKVILDIYYGSHGHVDTFGHFDEPGDSCYAYFNGNQYNFYFFHKDTLINKRFSENSNISYFIKSFKNSGDTIEMGRYYVLRNSTYNVVQSDKYKIGIWNTYENGKVIKSIDYDNYKINGENIVFDKKLNSSFNNQKLFADSILSYYFGLSFHEKYIKFNMGRSFYLNSNGKSIRFENALNDSDCSILIPHLYYDIVINDSVRFCPIKIKCYKVKTLHEFLTETNAFTIHIEGIDSSLTMFNEKAIDFIRIAKKYRYNIRSKDFFLEMIVEPKDECFAKYSFKMSEYKDKNISYKGKKYRGYFKTIIIDPKTGVIKELPREAEIIYESTEL